MWRDKISLYAILTALFAGLVIADSGATTTQIQKRNPVFDLAAWRGDSNSDHAQRVATHLYALSVAPKGQWQDRRLALARYYFAYGEYAECLGVLEIVTRSEMVVSQQASLMALRGSAWLLSGHVELAAQDLGNPALDAEPQIWLMRTVLKERQGKFDEAVTAFEKGRVALGTFPPHQATNFVLSAVRSAFQMDKFKIAESYLGIISKGALTTDQRAEIALLSGKIASKAGQFGKADKYFQVASQAGSRKFLAKATFSQIEQDLARGLLSAPDAIQRLQKLHYVWRGDGVEADILQALGLLQAQAGKWRAALSTLRQATTYIPSGRINIELAEKMRAIFFDLYANDAASDLPPLEALALFSDYRELTPLGAEGDQMIRKLSDRLMTAGFPDRAAGLLDHQVRYRLTGTPQAMVAIRLALVDLIANKPAEAVDILRLTKKNEVSEDSRTLRNQIEARALVQLNMFASALDLLEHDNSRTANYVRADAYWRAKQWPQLATHYRRVYDQAGTKITSEDQVQFLRWAFALITQGDLKAASSLGHRFELTQMAAPFGTAFTLLTSGRVISSADAHQMSSVLEEIDQLFDMSHMYKSDTMNKMTTTKAI
jgi:tetratricopeptide (TPR) repeat protein